MTTTLPHMTFCQQCAHCDTEEATRMVVRGSVVAHVTVGICTRQGGYFHGRHVPDWLTGCPDFEAADTTLATASLFAHMDARLRGL